MRRVFGLRRLGNVEHRGVVAFAKRRKKKGQASVEVMEVVQDEKVQDEHLQDRNLQNGMAQSKKEQSKTEINAQTRKKKVWSIPKWRLTLQTSESYRSNGL